MPTRPLVSFLVIGAQKAGTTALYDYLTEIPGISLPRQKEVHFFDDESIDWDRPDYDAYHANFAEHGEGLRGEATPIYCYWPGSLERIHAYNPAMKLILMLRDPAERAWSHWRMETARGVETEPFSWCVRQGRRRVFERVPWGHDREVSYVERGFYGEQIERVLQIFSPDQLLVLQANALRDDPTAVLGRVCAFLGLAAPPRLEPREVHVGRDMGGAPEADLAFLKGLYARDQARLRALAPILGLEARDLVGTTQQL